MCYFSGEGVFFAEEFFGEIRWGGVVLIEKVKVAIAGGGEGIIYVEGETCWLRLELCYNCLEVHTVVLFLRWLYKYL